jgi:PKD repeat protein
MKFFHLLTAVVIFTAIIPSYSQTAPAVDWDHCLGTYAAADDIEKIILSSSGNILLGGTTACAPGSECKGWFSLIDTFGNTLWTKEHGAEDSSRVIYSISETNDGSILFTGAQVEYNPKVNWVGKLDPAGNLLWDTLFSMASTTTWARSSIMALDDGFLFAGATYQPGSPDAWLIRFDTMNHVVWEQFFGGSSSEVSKNMARSKDGNFYVLCYSSSNDGDVSGNHGWGDYWLIKFDPAGNLLWQKCYGGSLEEFPNDIKVLKDGGFVLFGSSRSSDGDATGNKGGTDYWLVRTDSAGTILWQKNYGGSLDDNGASIIVQPDESFILTGSSYSANGDISNHHGSTTTTDFWIVKVSNDGQLIWEHSYGGSDYEGALTALSLSSGAVVVAGSSDSDMDGDVSEDCFDYDGGPLQSGWILKLFPDCAYVTASFDFLQNGNTTQFTSTSVNAGEWFWDFGDGTTDTTENPVHTYSSPGSYTVCLTASDSCSINTLCETITILSLHRTNQAGMMYRLTFIPILFIPTPLFRLRSVNLNV